LEEKENSFIQQQNKKIDVQDGKEEIKSSISDEIFVLFFLKVICQKNLYHFYEGEYVKNDKSNQNCFLW
jgi:hypothetical protein